MTTAVDEAMAAALGEQPQEPARPQGDAVAKSTGHSETVGGHHGPASEEQAEELVTKALQAARTFAEVMSQIIDRRVWEVLGYESPRTMIRDRFAGKLINPSTGKPYTASAVNRLSNSAWVVWSLSEVLELPASELHVLTSVLAKVPAGLGERYHQQLVDNIVADVEKFGAGSINEVNAIIDVHVSRSATNGGVTQPEGQELSLALDAVRAEDEQSTTVEDNTSDNDSQEEAEPAADAGLEETSEVDAEVSAAAFADEETWLDAQRDPSKINKSARVEEDDDEPADRFAEDAFEEEFARGSQAPEQAVTWEQALNAQRSTEVVATNVSRLVGLPQAVTDMADNLTQLSTQTTEAVNTLMEVCRSSMEVAGVKDADGLFDPLSDDELESLRDQVVTAVEMVPMIVATSQALAAFENVEGAPNVKQAVKASESVADAVANLEEFSSEIDFVLYP